MYYVFYALSVSLSCFNSTSPLQCPLWTVTQLVKLLEFVLHHTETSGFSEVQLLDGQWRKFFYKDSKTYL